MWTCPIEVAVNRLGRRRHIFVITGTASRSPTVNWFYYATNDRLFADFSIDHVTRCGGNSATISHPRTVVVPRRSGPSPSDDVIEVSIS